VTTFHTFTHRDYQEAVAKILTHYGFITQLEYWIYTRGAIHRLDIYARCGRKDLCDDATVAVEVSISSRLEKDIYAVHASKAKYGFVLALKSTSIPSIQGSNIFVVTSLEMLEDKVRELLKIPEDYPRITPKVISEIPQPTYRDLDEAFEVFNVPIELRERARRLLLHAYTTCYKLYVDNERWQPSMPLEQLYIVVGDEVAFSVLRQLGLVDLARDSPRRSYYVYVKDEQIAKIEAERHAEKSVERVKELIDRYGWEVALLAWVRGRTLWSLNEPVLDELKSLPPEWSTLSEEVRRELTKVVVAIGAIVPLLADNYSKFWGELEKLGLAFRCENFLELLPEARNIILDLIVGDVIRFSEKKELLSKLASLNLLYHYFPVRTPEMIKRLYEDLQTLGLGLGDLENVAKRLQQLGVVSPFNRDKPPHLIVYDEKKYREMIIEEIKSFYHSK
jgi:hypothetical protein